MSFTEIVVRTVSGKEISREFVRDSEYKAYIRSIRRQYKVVEEIASALTIYVVED